MISRHEPDNDTLLTSSAGSAISAKDIEREQLAAAMREFEARNGLVVTQPIIKRDVPARLTKPQPTAPQQCDPLLSPEEAAKYLGVSNSWVYRQHTLGTGPQSVRHGRSVKFRLSEIERYKAAHPDIREASKENRKRYGRQFIINGATSRKIAPTESRETKRGDAPHGHAGAAA